MQISHFRSALFATVAVVSAALPSAACAQTRSFNVPAQSAATGVAELGRQADTQILISAEDAAGRETRRVVGNYTTERALELLVEDTGLRVQRSGTGTFIVVPASGGGVSTAANGQPEEGVPEILVTGRRNWSLNTGIERTRDDAQPFVVLNQEDIRRSGSTNLEQFLRDYLNFNATEGTAEQSAVVAAGVAPRVQGVSSVDLRGLGSRETLILVDGRRQPALSFGEGEFRQSQITTIPLASIERIEVLASSAAGIYGMGATGGVINIILRRDYSGRQLILNYADTSDFRAADKRIDLVVGQSLEGGRTNISLNATYRQANPLLRRYRADFLEDNRRHILGNNPDFFGSQPPPGATPNIRSSNGQPLRLDARFGGATLSSNKLFIPEGYRGVAIDGIAPLLANLGQYNIEIPNTVDAGRRPLINGTNQLGGTLAVRREMTSWLRVYAESAYTIYRNKDIVGIPNGTFFIPGNAPNNPFQNQIAVRAPLTGDERVQRSKNTALRLVGGVIAELPYAWQAVADVAYGRGRWYRARVFEGLRDGSSANVTNGTFDLLQDTLEISFPFTFFQLLTPDLPFESKATTAALKLAGPVPIRLPGGRPTLTLNLEQTSDKLSDSYSVGGSAEGFASVGVVPARKQTIKSAYGEIRLPIIGESNGIPLIQGFEAVIAGRYEDYEGIGTSNGVQCFSSTNGLPAGITDPLELCNLDTSTLPRVTVSSSRFEPTFSAKWTVSPDIVFRGSYATGYLPPRLNNLIPTVGNIVVAATDPERPLPTGGFEQIGGAPIALISGRSGGNPDLRPERSKSITFGAILTPRFVPGLRFSVDYTRIKKRDNYFSPQFLAIAQGNAESQQRFNTFLKLFPERVTRGPASGGFAVGRITALDLTDINIAGTNVQALDFTLDYTRPFLGGNIDFAGSATHSIELSSRILPNDPVIDVTGARPRGGVTGGSVSAFGNTSLRWKGIGSVRWSNKIASIGVRARYFGPFDLNYEGTFDKNNNAVSIESQTYVDIFGSYQLTRPVQLNAGINNVFGKRPPFIDAGYSEFGDLRLTHFFVNAKVDF